jgi:hypothetical protein
MANGRGRNAGPGGAPATPDEASSTFPVPSVGAPKRRFDVAGRVAHLRRLVTKALHAPDHLVSGLAEHD